MNTDQLLKIMPLAKERIDIFYAQLIAAMAEFNINTRARQASFLSQVGQESGQLAYVVENLNYGAPGLLANFPAHFSAADAADYARQPERIANRAYANRGGNGDEASGDGWRYRGAGLIQLTMKTNQSNCAAHFGIDEEAIGDWLRTPEGACRSAGWFWATHGLNALADVGDQVAVTRRVNGGEIGLAGRLALFNVAEQVLA